jgi:EpsD family peptidyl-prolyl cis-trans isomerase
MMHKKIAIAAAAIAVAAMLTACGPKQEEKKVETAAPQDKSLVLAVVNGKNITEDEFKEEAATLSPLAVNSLSEAENRDKFLDNLIDKQLIVQKAEAMGLEKDPEVAKRIELLKSSLLLGLYVKNEVLDKVKITDQDVKAYFDANKDQLGSVRISHILVGTHKEAEDVLAKLKAGSDFAALARQVSLDKKTKGSGGDLGFVDWAQFGSSSLKDAAFKLKTGETSGIIQSSYGFHIMKVTAKKPVAASQYEKMKDSLRTQIEQKKKEERFDSIVKELKDKAKVERKAENIKAMNLSSLQQGATQPQIPGLQAPSAGQPQPVPGR